MENGIYLLGLIITEGLPLDCDLFYKIWDNYNEANNKAYISPAVWNIDSRNALIESGEYRITKFPNPDGGGIERHELTFTALQPTPENIKLPRIIPPGENGNEVYYNVKITGSPIMVKSSHGFKDSDRVREYLYRYGGSTVGIHNKGEGEEYALRYEGGFGPTMVNVEEYVPNTKDRPYQLPVGDEITFYVDTLSEDDTFSYGNRDADHGDWVDGDSIREIVSDTTTPLANGMYRHQVTLKGKAAGYVQVWNTGTDETIEIRIWEPGGGKYGQTMNHADMEIADGGTYTISSTHVGEDGKTYVEVKVYKADVTFVNDAYIYDDEGRELQHYTSEFDPNYPLYTAKIKRDEVTGKPIPDDKGNVIFLDENGDPLPYDEHGDQIVEHEERYQVNGEWRTRYVSHKVLDKDHPVGDYEQFGVPGGTQYEMTSAWISNLSDKANKKTFDGTAADRAEFDVNLHLTPQKKITYIVNDDGTLTMQEDKFNPDHLWDGTGDDLVTYDPEHLVFKMDHQDVLDAINKCPLNNGLDFTARAEFTVLQLPVQKKLLNGSLADKSFRFNVIDLNDTPLLSSFEEAGQQIADTAMSDEEGKAVMSSMRFVQPGNYYFKLEEEIPEIEKRDGYEYDDTVIYIRVKVQKDEETGFLVAVPEYLKDDGSGNPENFEVDTERTEAEFTNYKGYELPHTGGTGTLPFMAGGMLLISAAFVLPLIRRRKEDETDS